MLTPRKLDLLRFVEGDEQAQTDVHICSGQPEVEDSQMFQPFKG